MKLSEYNRLRGTTDTGPLFAWTAVIVALLGGLAQSILVVFAAVCALIALGALAVRRRNRADLFRCPGCGKTPHQWISPDPSDDRVCTDYDVDACLHCRFDLRGSKDGSA
ncbi:hypothetical protein [Lysobacter sp. CA199]|uniref:hypothetical protein n=1 Tax=Lysobacter sp. CA199 TaxID=3455608 RepID=UPI003F8CF4E1